MERNQWLDDLAKFIVEANKNTWAAEGTEVAPEREGYKELEYKKGEWRLRDSYTGYFRAPGMTTVYFKDRPAWTMAYGGTGQLEGHEEIVKPTFAFLRKTLMQVSPKMPFRGPEFFEEGDWRYTFELLSNNDITDFSGREEIRNQLHLHGGIPVFQQTMFGGIVIPKNSERKPLHPWNF